MRRLAAPPRSGITIVIGAEGRLAQAEVRHAEVMARRDRRRDEFNRQRREAMNKEMLDQQMIPPRARRNIQEWKKTKKNAARWQVMKPLRVVSDQSHIPRRWRWGTTHLEVRHQLVPQSHAANALFGVDGHHGQQAITQRDPQLAQFVASSDRGLQFLGQL